MSKNACRVAALRPGLAHTIALEERLQSGGVAAGLAHTIALLMVRDAGQVALPAPVGDLVHADQNEPVKTGLVEVIRDDALHDVADRVPRNPQGIGVLLLGKNA